MRGEVMMGKDGKSGRRYKSHKLKDVMPTGMISSKIICVSCKKEVDRKGSLSDHRLKDSGGHYCRFCINCKEVFIKAVNAVDDPTGLVFDEGIEVDLGDKDPFFRIRFFSEEGGMPSWKVVPFDDETGGLLVFVRRVGSFVSAKEVGGPKHLTCKIVITKKSTRVAFAEPYIPKPVINGEAKEQKSEQDKPDEAHEEVEKTEVEGEKEEENEVEKET